MGIKWHQTGKDSFSQRIMVKTFLSASECVKSFGEFGEILIFWTSVVKHQHWKFVSQTASKVIMLSLPQWLSGKESACQWRRCGFGSWVGKILLRRKWQPTPVFLPGESHGQRSLVGYSPWGCKESDTTETAGSLSFSIQCLRLLGHPDLSPSFSVLCSFHQNSAWHRIIA